MFDREIHIRFTLAGVFKLLFLSPLVAVLILGLLSLPWGSESAPAWVQAIGSVMALIGAATLPIVHSRHVELRKEKMVLGQLRLLAEECYEKLWMLSNCFLSRDREHYAIENFLHAGRDHEWQALEQAVTQYPLELVPAQHLSMLSTLRNSVSHALMICRRLSEWKECGSNPALVGLLRSRRDLLGFEKQLLPWPEGHTLLLDKFHQERGIASELANPPPGPVDRYGAKVYVTWQGPKERPDLALVQIVMPAGEPEVLNMTLEGVTHLNWVDWQSASVIVWDEIERFLLEEFHERAFGE